jgi:L-serine kinase (ATP) / ParB family transcriptional regulator, heme-responsive regulator
MEAKELRLSIVPLDQVFLHEEIEQKRVDGLIERLRSDRVLRNPPIVTEVKAPAAGTRYIVLDGASRTSALRAIECRDVLVQVVDYASPELRLESWNHLLLDVSPAGLRREIDDLSCIGMEEMAEAAARRALERREVIGYFKFGDGRVAGLRCSGDLAEQARALNQVVETYQRKAEVYRVSTTDLEQLAGEHRRLSAVMVFPKYRPEEIVKLALNGSNVPMGITRHIIPGRALRVNVPLTILESDQSLDEKNTWLDQWLKQKIQERRVRYYQEPVFLFDE